MSELGKNSGNSGFDVLGPDFSLKVGNESDDDCQTLVLGTYPAIIEIGITHEGVRDVRIRYQKLKEQILEIEMPLGIPVEDTFEILWSLGVKVKCDNLLTVEVPLAITRAILDILTVQAPLLAKWKIFIQVDRHNESVIKLHTTNKVGEKRVQVIETLNELRKKLREED